MRLENSVIGRQTLRLSSQSVLNSTIETMDALLDVQRRSK